MYERWFNKVSGTLLFLAALTGAPGAVAATPYTVAVVPQFPAVEIHRTWSPLLERLGAETGLAFTLQQFASIPEFERAFLAGKPDLVFLNPYHMVMAAGAQRYTPLVRDGAKLLSGILVVRSDSAVKSLADLQDQTVAFPAPNAFGASLYLRALLTEASVKFRPDYVKTHTNAYRHVLAGEVAAAGGVRATLDRESPDVQGRLRVLYETPAVPAHPLAAHPRVPSAAQLAVREAMIRIAASDEGKALLRGIQMPAPVISRYEADYAPLKRLGLDRFVVRGAD
jgi:phosphonate transport system substrate-binding protein